MVFNLLKKSSMFLLFMSLYCISFAGISNSLKIVDKNSFVYAVTGTQSYKLLPLEDVASPLLFRIEDINYDGHSDILIKTGQSQLGSVFEILVFDVKNNRFVTGFLPALEEPRVDRKNRILETVFKDAGYTYKQHYCFDPSMKDYFLCREWKTVSDDGIVFSLYDRNKNVSRLQLLNKQGKIMTHAVIRTEKSYLYDSFSERSKNYLIKGDSVRVDNLVSYNDSYYLKITYSGKRKISKLILLDDVLSYN